MIKQKGFTLIELMIASLIGLIIMAGLFNLFITTNRSATLSDALSQNQETGRFAMEYLTKFIRRSGFNDQFTISIPPIFGAFSGGAVPITCTGADFEEEACSVNDFSTIDPTEAILGDRLGIPYVVSNATTQSCTGQLLPAVIGSYYVDTFWVVGNEASNQFQDLVCRTYDVQNGEWLGGELVTAVSIINHVERFEFQVGLANDVEAQNTARYVNFATAQATPDYSYLVRSIRIAILTTSQDLDNINRQQSMDVDKVYTLLDAEEIQRSDSVLRNIFMNTIELTNLIESTLEN
jgi:type IV pilus assembly protein PilW